MLSKCANPGCPVSFRYLHQGKLFRLDTGPEYPVGQTTQKAVRTLEFFWLCDQCAATLTLTYKKGVGVTAVPIRQPPSADKRERSASAS